MYYIDGIVYVSVSKGVVALDAETGKQLLVGGFQYNRNEYAFL